MRFTHDLRNFEFGEDQLNRLVELGTHKYLFDRLSVHLPFVGSILVAASVLAVDAYRMALKRLFFWFTVIQVCFETNDSSLQARCEKCRNEDFPRLNQDYSEEEL